ncbi:hypothetical protein HGRIS_007250 [Hohenbuehelia grisea]|uniref:Uncharacterized protein n=1 Tax=Hohenbuehelia grisea TaxID=104357 RepID=A0ABR3JBM8_9AGAR
MFPFDIRDFLYVSGKEKLAPKFQASPGKYSTYSLEGHRVGQIDEASASADISEEEVAELARRNINGRQIKNAARTAQSLASAQGEKMSFRHLIKTLDAMEEFAEEFEAMRLEKT